MSSDPKLKLVPASASPSGESPEAPLYAKREPVCPSKVEGRFRRFKWAVMAFCLIVYWGTPWVRWDRGPWAPHQAVLVDLAHRRFYMFGIEIWPHEFYFVAGLLIMAGIGLFLVTSAVGRAWCGYACPQTVWTDLFQHVDRLVEGDRNAQLALARGPWTAKKWAKRLTKWAIFLAISFATGGAWIFYFEDAPTLNHEFWTGQAPVVAYATVAVLTFTTFWLGGFMREQVCVYMCPWPRIQSAMLDEKSLIVTYKDWRGEPRGSLKQAQRLPGAVGDCIDCKQCVAVCPTGIDIREGAQIGCITCGLCIDACDRVMGQVGRERGLIDYCTLEDAEQERAGAAPRRLLHAILRPRTLVYLGVWSAIGLGLLFMLGERSRLDLSVARDRNPEFVQLSDGSVRDGFTIKLRNMEGRPRATRLSLDGLPEGRIYTDEMEASAARTSLAFTVPADTTERLRVYVVVPEKAARPQSFAFRLEAQAADGQEAAGDRVKTEFAAPAAALTPVDGAPQ